MVKNPPARQETRVSSLGQEGPMGKNPPARQETRVSSLGQEGPMVKNQPARQETRVWSLAQEGPMEVEVLEQPTPVCLSRKSHGQRSLMGYSPCSCKDSDMTEHTNCCTIRLKQLAHPNCRCYMRRREAGAARIWSWPPLSSQAFPSACSQNASRVDIRRTTGTRTRAPSAGSKPPPS